MMEVALETDLTWLPRSFMILHELDEFRKKEHNSNIKQTELLFMDYEMICKLFIAVDGNIDQAEVKMLNNYMKILRKNLNEFKIIGYSSFVHSLNSKMMEWEIILIFQVLLKIQFIKMDKHMRKKMKRNYYNNKEYFFNFEELDAAIVYVEKIQREAMWNNMSNESKDEINSIIDDVMTKAGYTKNRR